MSPRPVAILLTAATVALGALAPAASADSAVASIAVGHNAPAKAAKKKKDKAKAEKAKKRKSSSKAKSKAKRKKAKPKIDAALPQAWAKRYKVAKAKGDPDRDGLSNLGEAQAGLNPRKADTDGDGIDDGDEHAGVITAISPLGATIATFGGGTVSGAFSPDTAFACAEDVIDDAVDDATDLIDENRLAQDEDDSAEDPADDAADLLTGDDDASDDGSADDEGGDDTISACGAVGDRVYEAVTDGGVFDSFDLVG